MIWISISLVAVVLAGWLLKALYRYEHESATAALEEVQRLNGELAKLTIRIEVLEAIAVAADNREDALERGRSSDVEEESLSLRPRSRTGA